MYGPIILANESKMQNKSMGLVVGTELISSILIVFLLQCCTVFLLFCIAVKLGILSSCDEKRAEVAWNNTLRKIFNAYWHESVKPLQSYCSCLPVSILLPTMKLLFWKKMLCSGNLILCRLAKCSDASIFVWLRNSTSNLTTMFVLVLRILRTVFGFIFKN